MGADSAGPPTSVYPTEAVNEQQQQLPVTTATAPVTTATALSLLGLAGEAN